MIFEYLNKIDIPIFTISFCAIILIIYILDNFIIIPKTETVSLKENYGQDIIKAT